MIAPVIRVTRRQELVDTGLEPVTSCVSSRTSMSETSLTTPRTAFFGVKTGVAEPITVALRWCYARLTG